jgi:hypothetical protein
MGDIQNRRAARATLAPWPFRRVGWVIGKATARTPADLAAVPLYPAARSRSTCRPRRSASAIVSAGVALENRP